MVRRVDVEREKTETLVVARVRRRASEQEYLPEISLRLARVIRSGVPLEAAIRRVDADMFHAHRNLNTAAHHLAVGRPIAQVASAWAQHSRSDAERLLLGVLELGVETGADLAVALDAVGEAVRDDIEHDKRRRILLTQNQMSAAVLVCLPLVFALVASLTRGFVYGTPLGMGLLISGLLLDIAGVLWIRRLLGRLR